MILGKLIRAYRLQNNIGVRQLARQLGINHSSLFRFERGGIIESRHLTKIYAWVLADARVSDRGA